MELLGLRELIASIFKVEKSPTAPPRFVARHQLPKPRSANARKRRRRKMVQASQRRNRK